MKSRITKQVKKELKEILDQKGYWSDETRIFIEQFNFATQNKLHQIAQVYDKYNYGL